MLEPRTVGEALTLLRHRSGMRLDDVAGRAGVAPSTLGGYEHDSRSPQAHILRQVIDVLAAKLGENADDAWAEVGSLIGVAQSRRRTVGQAGAGRTLDPRRTIALDAVVGDADDDRGELTG